MKALVRSEGAGKLDGEARASWSLDTLALIEAAGRSACGVFLDRYPGFFSPGNIRVCAASGTGNNGADGLVMLKTLILKGLVKTGDCSVILAKDPREGSPQSVSLGALRAMGVAAHTLREGGAVLEKAGLIIDGIAGTGLEGPLTGGALDLVLAVNRVKDALVVSIDLPSGGGDKAGASWPVVEACATLAIEPLKTVLYKPLLRKKAGRILPVEGIFPPQLVEKYREARLWSWDDACLLAAPPAPDGYKYGRGLAEIWAGSDGAAGAARIAARGAAAAGAGLVRLMADPSLYSILAAGEGGIMVVPADGTAEPGGYPRFKSDVILAGPGWGQGRGRLALLERILDAADRGIPVLLDADALILARSRRFTGSVLLTPHAGELEKFSGIPREELLARPEQILPALSRESGAVIAFKSHVIWTAAPDGRLAVVDGMVPALAVGGSGDLLAGLASGFAARARGPDFDWFPCAVAAASLLMAAGREGERGLGFADPLALASLAGHLAYKMPILKA